MDKRRLALWTFVAFALLALAGPNRIQPAHAAPPLTIPMAVVLPPAEEICNYTVVFYDRNALLINDTTFNSNLLEVAHACGTKVIVRLHQYSGDITNPNGGLDLVAFENKINDFAGLIDPYVNNGTIIAHLVLDEPHDCAEWNGTCPTPAEADQASLVSKDYWPTLSTMINTMPNYAAKYVWVHTDDMNFTYAYHKGPLAHFITHGAAVLTSGRVAAISWGIQATWGGVFRLRRV